ncbi:flagellar basal-body MS-ring/collar protein FliF [Thalassococcus lentus]|uniref:Flagellar M-ring protein n=2 Tax=Thalassococcus lentus TaxID=1210524 RepID=A0ABT4XMU7_9RHOB|nr:flagellar basal-body MS-ring/collar protein FliF [Thalassococcus lentus]MDA7423263.1 flagellar basal-body MS-ring/collar protein FliF [Thalassococcus lentus]
MQLFSVWNALSIKQRLIVFGASIAMALSVLGLARMASAPSMALLYAGLENGAAGEVVQALESRAVVYEIRGGAIFVPQADRDALRLTLASEGMPANSTQGYELLDGLSGFGTTSQMFDAAYWRAKEGELSRTIVANPAISSARVHIANSSANPFQRDVTPTASISVTTAGGTLSQQQARALKFLVASAVPGLDPEEVAVIDGKGGLISGESETAAGPNARDRVSDLRDRVQRLMEARVGVGNAVVEVSVDTVTESESILERRIDPQGRVVISTDTEERSDNTQDAGGGDVSVASNLPDGVAGGGDGSRSQATEIRERINYEVSETTREITRGPGAIKRLTVAVLVNGRFTTDEQGAQQFQPLPDTELESLRELVSSAVGFDEQRGDRITIHSMPFDRPEGLGTGPIEPGFFSGELDIMRLAQMAVLGFVALMLGLFVVRPVLMRSSAEMPSLESAALPAPVGAPESVLVGEIDPTTGPDVIGAEKDLDPQKLPALASQPKTLSEEDPVDRLRGLISDRKTETVEILRSWLDEKEQIN